MALLLEDREATLCFVFTVHNSILHSTVCVVILCICVDYGHDGLCVQTSVCTDGLTETNQ